MIPKKSLHILVVEDNEGDFMLVKHFLQEIFRNAVIQHEDMLGRAITAISKEQFDVILLDLSLPDSSGIQSVIEVVNVANSAPVIVLTGFGNKDFAIETLAAGVEDYLVKDEINPTTLSKSINYSLERNRIRRELQKQQALFRALIEKSPDMKTLVTTEGKIIYGTPSITAYLGYTEEDYLNRIHYSLVHPEDTDILRIAMDEVISVPGSSTSFIVRVRHKDGSYRWCEKTITNLLEDPNVSALVCNFWEVTERIHHIQEIELQNILLKDIAWIQSHEVRAPMARIMGIISILNREEYNPDPATAQLLNHVVNSAHELDRIIKKIVDKTHELKKIN
jgi:PAS domain S-box-containing protein